MPSNNAQSPAVNSLNFRSYYTQLIISGKTDEVIKQLRQQLPEFAPNLEALQAHYDEIKRQATRATITQENSRVETNRINMALIAFLDDLSKGDNSLAASHLAIGDEANSVLDEVLDNQLEFNKNAVRENKVFRTAVGLLFLVAVIFSAIVLLRHYDFLKEDIKVVGMLATTIALYIGIGILALFALSLIIKGSLFNQVFLNFSKKTLKR
ncbi:hypothetical protein [Lewinella cohaerens]|uniref:hypothetical protein n=1 Tax=Lewinella cohaerens TaxID=70995 RepID=UPI000368EACF|nr:hypothetical protein [Lewinella cohaerens]